MLIEVLETFTNKKTQSIQNLALQLDISEALLRQMIFQLVRTGYLTPVINVTGEGCGQQCKKKSCFGCSFLQQSSLTGWVLTEKGRQYLEQAKFKMVTK